MSVLGLFSPLHRGEVALLALYCRKGAGHYRQPFYSWWKKLKSGSNVLHAFCIAWLMGHMADILLAKLEKCFLCFVSSSHWIVTILKTVRKSDFTRHKNTHKASYIMYIFHASKLTLNSLWYKILPSWSNFFELPAFFPYPKFYYKRDVTSNSDNNPFCSFSFEQVKVQEVWTLI